MTILSTIAALAAGCSAGGPALDLPLPDPPAADDGKYFLPFAAGVSTVVAQGNFGIAGQWSHAHKYAIDFVLPLRTHVLAARTGVVDFIRDTCPNENCPFDEERCCGNYIRIRHDDGSVAAYWHLVQGGSCVTVGQRIQRGDVIGLSGNTGISVGPHLHFMVFAPPGEFGAGGLGPSKDNSMEVSFEDVAGSGVPVLLMTVQSRNEQKHDYCADKQSQ